MAEGSAIAVASSLVAGVDYPTTHRQLTEWFATERACAEYLVGLRWPDGYTCTACGTVDEPWWRSAGRLICRHCRAQRSLRAGTIFEQTKTPLPVWFAAAWMVASAKNGFSAMTLSRTLGVSYNTAWVMLHRFRVAMVRSERGQLSGLVEVDETFVGGEASGGKPGRGSETQVPVAVAVELHEPKGFGRCRLALIQDASRVSVERFVTEVIAPGSRVATDSWHGYDHLEELGYAHEATNLSADDRPAHKVHPGVHRVASLLKRWLLSTHQGSVRPEHLQGYLEEFTFRFNRRRSRSRGLVFRRLLEQGVATGPVTRRQVVGGWWPPPAIAPEATPEGVVWTLVVTTDYQTRRNLLRRLDTDQGFAAIGHAADDPKSVSNYVDRHKIGLVIIDGDGVARHGKLVEAAVAQGAKVAFYARQLDSPGARAARHAGAGLGVTKAAGRKLLRLCLDLANEELDPEERGL